MECERRAGRKPSERERSGERTRRKTMERERSVERRVAERERSGERGSPKVGLSAERLFCRSRSAHMLWFRRWTRDGGVALSTGRSLVPGPACDLAGLRGRLLDCLITYQWYPQLTSIAWRLMAVLWAHV